MGEHLIDGEFQSDKYPTCPRGKVPLSCADPMAQDLLWAYASRREPTDAVFAEDLREALLRAGYRAPDPVDGGVEAQTSVNPGPSAHPDKDFRR